MSIKEPRDVERCTKWCRERWQELVDSIELVREAAREEGVEMVSLRP